MDESQPTDQSSWFLISLPRRRFFVWKVQATQFFGYLGEKKQQKSIVYYLASATAIRSGVSCDNKGQVRKNGSHAYYFEHWKINFIFGPSATQVKTKRRNLNKYTGKNTGRG